MTCIINSTKYPTKKALKLAVAQDALLVGQRPQVYITDPSIVNPRFLPVTELHPGEEVVVTNHPKRSWFAQVGRKADGTLYVK